MKEKLFQVLQALPEKHNRIAVLLCWCHFLSFLAFLVMAAEKSEMRDNIFEMNMTLLIANTANYLMLCAYNTILNIWAFQQKGGSNHDDQR